MQSRRCSKGTQGEESMKEMENSAQWSRFTVVMQMEWEDQRVMSGFLVNRLWAAWAARQVNAVVSAVECIGRGCLRR